MSHRARVLVIAPWYEPAFQAGGIVRAVVNMVEAVAGDLDVHVITSDRDLGSDRPYPDVEPGRWLDRGSYHILHLPPGPRSFARMATELRRGGWDSVHINGLFSSLYSTWPLIVLRSCRPRPRVIVQSHGMLGEGALRLKSTKKQVYLNVARAIGLYHDVIWHATSELEDAEIRAVVGAGATIQRVTNVPDRREAAPPGDRAKRPGAARFCFFSRISPKKGLREAIDYLARSAAGPGVVFDVLGPIEDAAYWADCRRELDRLSGRIASSHKGPIAPADVHGALSGYHFMVLPTYNENFGYAILDALLAGCPVILSDQTPWRDLAATGAGWTIPLADADRFARTLDECVAMDGAEYARRSAAAHAFAMAVIRDPTVTAELRRLLYAGATS